MQTGEAHNQSVVIAAHAPAGAPAGGEDELRRLAADVTADTGLPFDLGDTVAEYEQISPSPNG